MALFVRDNYTTSLSAIWNRFGLFTRKFDMSESSLLHFHLFRMPCNILYNAGTRPGTSFPTHSWSFCDCSCDQHAKVCSYIAVDFLVPE
jgi:hypothetical protein